MKRKSRKQHLTEKLYLETRLQELIRENERLKRMVVLRNRAHLSIVASKQQVSQRALGSHELELCRWFPGLSTAASSTELDSWQNYKNVERSDNPRTDVDSPKKSGVHCIDDSCDPRVIRGGSWDIAHQSIIEPIQVNISAVGSHELELCRWFPGLSTAASSIELDSWQNYELELCRWFPGLSAAAANVELDSWDRVVAFCRAQNKQMRLPTEWNWQRVETHLDKVGNVWEWIY